MIDAIVISDSGDATFSASSPLRLHLDGKIALIQTVRNFLGNGGSIVEPIEGETRDNWHSAPKLNGLAICDYLRKRGFGSVFVDSYFRDKAKFLDLVREGPRAIIVSTTFIPDKRTLRQLVADIRSHAPGIPIIAGGPFVYSSYLLAQRSKDPDYDLGSPREDYLFLGEETDIGIDLLVIDKGGLQVLDEALIRISKGQGLDGLPNTARWKGDAYVFSERRELEPTDSAIDWSSMPDGVFDSRVANIQASVGCPFDCEFCNFVKDRRYTRIKPLDELIGELKAVAERGVKYVRFVDDNFRLGRNDLDEVCRRFIDEGLDLKWMSFIRASTLDTADIGLLKRAGCIETQMGIESADRTVLRKMRKDADPAMYHRVISRLLAEGIDCSCCFIVGFPGETEDTFRKTVEFIESVPNDGVPGSFFWSIYPFFLAPLSPVYEPRIRAECGLEGYMGTWRHATMDSPEAVRLIKQAFLRIENAGPIYSGDNMEMIRAMDPDRRHAFFKTRHALSKAFLRAPFDPAAALAAFSGILSPEGE